MVRPALIAIAQGGRCASDCTSSIDSRFAILRIVAESALIAAASPALSLRTYTGVARECGTSSSPRIWRMPSTTACSAAISRSAVASGANSAAVG